MFKLFSPDEEPEVRERVVDSVPDVKLIAEPVQRKSHPRCACGCGKAAFWPRDGKPLFHTRLCGYQMKVDEIRRKEAQ